MTDCTYSKLASSLITSSLWREDNVTRLVFITMLALKDKNGHVAATLPGLAAMANVSLEDCKRAITRLEAPDEHSRTKDHQGRRIASVIGGWTVLNHYLYRDGQTSQQKREYQRQWIAKKRLKSKMSTLSTDVDIDTSRQQSTAIDKGSTIYCTDTDTDTELSVCRQPVDPGRVPPLNHPPLEEAVAHFKKPQNGSYTSTAVKRAFLSFEAATDEFGNWFWGKRQVTDWRAAMEARIQSDLLNKKTPQTADKALQRALKEVDRL